jgi:hypothetical protein
MRPLFTANYAVNPRGQKLSLKTILNTFLTGLSLTLISSFSQVRYDCKVS